LKKNIILFIILSVLFSCVNSFAIEFFIDERKCVISSSQYSTELKKSLVNTDVCKIHHKCHHAYILNQNQYISKLEFRNINEALKITNYIFQIFTFLLKPPIV